MEIDNKLKKSKKNYLNSFVGIFLALTISCLSITLYQKNEIIRVNDCALMELKKTVQESNIENNLLSVKNNELKAQNAELLNEVEKSKDAIHENELLKSENQILKNENDGLKQYKTIVSNISRGVDNSFARVKRIEVEISMYSRAEVGYHKTASGTDTHWGVIAAPKEIPFGTKIIIAGFENTIFNVEDRGGYIKKVGDTYRIDIFVETKEEAIKFGRQTRIAYIISW